MAGQKALLGKVIWLRWVLACAAAWVVSGVLFRSIYSAVQGSVGGTAGGILGLAALGAAIGSVQWSVLPLAGARNR